MGIHLRIYKDSPNSTEFQGMNHTPDFDPNSGVPYQRLSPQSGSDWTMCLSYHKHNKCGRRPPDFGQVLGTWAGGRRPSELAGCLANGHLAGRVPGKRPSRVAALAERMANGHLARRAN